MPGSGPPPAHLSSASFAVSAAAVRPSIFNHLAGITTQYPIYSNNPMTPNNGPMLTAIPTSSCGQ